MFDKVTVEISVDESQTHSYKLRLTCLNPVLPKIENTSSSVAASKKRPLSATKPKNNNSNNNNSKQNGSKAKAQENESQKKKIKVK